MTIAYNKSSLLHLCDSVSPDMRLLLIHGTADDNVYFSHSLKLVDKLFREGLMLGGQVQLLPVANLTHMVPMPIILERMWGKIAQFISQGR